jgi:hypothetical protein
MITSEDMAAVDLALEAEYRGVAIEQLAEQCPDRVIEFAHQLQQLIIEMRHELHERAAERGVPRDVADQLFRDVLQMMLGRRGSLH